MPFTSTIIYTLGSDCTTLGSASTVQQIQEATVQGLAKWDNVSVGDVSIIATSNSCLGSSGRHLLRGSRGLHSSGDEVTSVPEQQSQQQPSSSQPQQLQTTYGTLAMTTQVKWPKGMIRSADEVRIMFISVVPPFVIKLPPMLLL